jgi:peptide-methionine (S)-S-oxide reductase
VAVIESVCYALAFLGYGGAPPLLVTQSRTQSQPSFWEVFRCVQDDLLVTVARNPVLFDDHSMITEKAMFGAGCFWGVEETFRNLKGVVSTAVGYAGGTKENPTYEDVCTDRTGHAEVVEVEFDPSQTTYDELLNVFWSNHNPTTLNRQGPDVGTQYRSVIFYYSPEQESTAKASKGKLETSGRFNRPIVTQIEPAPTFWRAEEYHQRYLQKRGQSHCAV